MNRVANFEKGVFFIEQQKARLIRKPGALIGGHRYRSVVLSRESASGAHAIAEKLVEYLQPHARPINPPWTVFDHNLVEKVLEEHHLPERLAKFMPEDAISQIDDIIDDLFGLHPSSEILVRQISKTILRLAKLGRVILVGRAAAVISRNLPQVLRVRLVAPLEQRIEYMRQVEGLSRKEAAERVHDEDHSHKRYMKRYFHENAEDPLLYHLMINTGQVSLDQAVRLIAGQVLESTKVRAEEQQKAA